MNLPDMKLKQINFYKYPAVCLSIAYYTDLRKVVIIRIFDPVGKLGGQKNSQFFSK